MISVYNESLICDCAEILRPQHFVVVCEHTSIHDDILSIILASNLVQYLSHWKLHFTLFYTTLH